MGRGPSLSIKHAGSIEHDIRNRTWRVKIELNRKTHTGPRRSSKAEAKSDQAEGRRTASRQAFAEVLRQLTFTAGNQTSRSSAPQLASLKPKKMRSKPAVQPNSLRSFVLKRHHIDLILTGLKTLEILCRR